MADLPSIPNASSSSSTFTKQWSQLPKVLIDSIINLLKKKSFPFRSNLPFPFTQTSMADLPTIPTASSSSSTFTEQWSQLPDDLLDSITNLLNLDDLFRFSNVCKTWNSVSSSLLPPKLNTPFLIIPHEELQHSSTSQTDLVYPTWNKTLGFFSLCNGKVYNIDVPQVINRRICGSCNGGWLVTVHENSEIQVLHPFSKVVIDLPPIVKLPNVYSAYDKKKKKIVYNMLLEVGDQKIMRGINSDLMRDKYVHKVIMSCSASCSDVKKGIVVALQGFQNILTFFRIGKDKKWNIVNGDYIAEHALVAEAIFYEGGNLSHIFVNGYDTRFEDVTFYQGKCYTVRSSGHVFVVEGMESLCPTIKSIISRPTYSACDKYYLVESLGTLLMVTRSRFNDFSEEDDDPIIYQTTSFTAHRLDFDGPKWVEVSNIGKDCSLFVGFNQSFSLKTSDFPGCEGNCIYFIDDYACYE